LNWTQILLPTSTTWPSVSDEHAQHRRTLYACTAPPAKAKNYDMDREWNTNTLL